MTIQNDASEEYRQFWSSWCIILKTEDRPNLRNFWDWRFEDPFFKSEGSIILTFFYPRYLMLETEDSISRSILILSHYKMGEFDGLSSLWEKDDNSEINSMKVYFMFLKLAEMIEYMWSCTLPVYNCLCLLLIDDGNTYLIFRTTIKKLLQSDYFVVVTHPVAYQVLV